MQEERSYLPKEKSSYSLIIRDALGPAAFSLSG
jgi:hypothetical protein